MLSEVREGPFGAYLDLCDLFPPGVFAYLTLKSFRGVDPPVLSSFLESLGHGRVDVRRVEQVHSDRVVSAEETPCPADAIVCRKPGMAARVVAADCVPVLLAAADGRRVAAVHAGWKGTQARIAQGAALKLGDGACEKLVAYLGPAIGPCCYHVGEERMALFREAFPGWPLGSGGSSLDLHTLNALQLREAGIPAASIHVEDRCTACSVELCCSYRRDGELAGRMAALVGRTPWEG